MSWAYFVRLVVWAGLLIGFGWVAAGWFTRVPDEVGGRPAEPKTVAASRPQPEGFFSSMDRYVNRPVNWARENWVFLAETVVLTLLGWGALARGLGVYDLVYAESRWVRFVTGVVVGLLFGNMLLVAYLFTQNSIP